MFIKKTNLRSDSEQMAHGLNSILQLFPWPEGNQIGLTYRPGATNIWTDAVGSLYDRKNNIMLGKESDFTQWNDAVSDYLKTQCIALCELEGVTLGRVRFMRLKPKTGLTVHYDKEVRYHYVLETNPFSYISKLGVGMDSDSDLLMMGRLYHIPKNNNWYRVDTRQQHFVYNGGDTDRIHLVLCAL